MSEPSKKTIHVTVPVLLAILSSVAVAFTGVATIFSAKITSSVNAIEKQSALTQLQEEVKVDAESAVNRARSEGYEEGYEKGYHEGISVTANYTTTLPKSNTTKRETTTKPNTTKNEVVYLGEQIRAADLDHAKEVSSNSEKNFTMGGVVYTNGALLDMHSSVVYFVNKKYTSFSGIVGHVDGTGGESGIMKIYLDGKLREEFQVSYDIIPKEFSYNIEKVTQIKITLSNDRSYRDSEVYAVANPIIE